MRRRHVDSCPPLETVTVRDERRVVGDRWERWASSSGLVRFTSFGEIGLLLAALATLESLESLVDLADVFVSRTVGPVTESIKVLIKLPNKLVPPLLGSLSAHLDFPTPFGPTTTTFNRPAPLPLTRLHPPTRAGWAGASVALPQYVWLVRKST